MTDAELAAITEALHESKRELDAVDHLRRGPKTRAIVSLGIALELLTDVVYRMSKRR